MNPSDHNEIDGRIKDEAAAWFCERDEGFKTGREALFKEWLQLDSRHRRAFARVERAQGLLGEMPFFRDSLRMHFPVVQPSEPVIRRKNPWPWWLGLAAGLALALFAWRGFPGQPYAEVYVTNENQPQRVALADGSVVDINASSRVEVSMNSHERRINLTSGEAHFQVMHDRTRPFIVTANGLEVRALGTAFNVRLSGQKIDLLVVEGKVEVGEVKFLAISPAVLVAGERTEVENRMPSNFTIEKVDAVKIHELLEWQDRMTNFNDVPLREIIARMNRCNGVHMVIVDQKLGEKKLGGVIALGNVNAFIELLKQSGDITVEYRGEEILFHSSR